jgi:hypothetical protein
MSRTDQRDDAGAFGGLTAKASDAAPPASSPKRIRARIAAAEANRETQTLASLYLELARAEGAAGNGTAELQALRSAAGLGALHGPKTTHAAARLALAEIAVRSGDMTTACEHWQIARIAYSEAGAVAQSDSIDKLMRENGCPTDWVLTDF